MSRRGWLGGFYAVAAGIVAWRVLPAFAGESAVVIPTPAEDLAAGGATTTTAVFAGGCFWGVQAVFQHVKGVRNAVSGYAGGAAATASYEQVGSGRTGHAEAVQISYDPAEISYGQLLQIYFSVAHDPTQLNRQGPDSGTQYRSTIFPANAEQMRVAKNYIAQLDKARVFGAKIATTVEPGAKFYAAEAYHQDFLVRHPSHPYIVINDKPKVENLQRVFADRFRAQPVLVGAGA
ncbi:peptide-methionine (S)-S-oxide reductase [Rhodoferax koreense]|uniref:Peptide methionine sulfoxide reductase MsrA n=1 Tax=Rhodoferax koreensis TaxID=1842727 RepID=A0A1P8K3B8_9BURK|nr:peptide-methionine (S)-S-oxide reductase [Rhodoferax koreense]